MWREFMARAPKKKRKMITVTYYICLQLTVDVVVVAVVIFEQINVHVYTHYIPIKL